MANTFMHAHTGARHGYDRNNAVVDRALQRSRYGGMHFGTAFFGWLVSTGIATILTGILTAAGTAVALTSVRRVSDVTNNAATIGVAGGILLLIILAVAYFAGGYVAGRMARFDGARQGLGVWIIGIAITIILAAIGAGLGAKYNVLQQINLPHIPVKQGSFTTGGLITSIVAIVLTLVAAMGGGKIGEGYHRKVDDAGTIDQGATD